MSQFRNIKEMKNYKMSKAKDQRVKFQSKEHIIIGGIFEHEKKRNQSPNLKQLLTNSILDQKFNNASVIDTKELINIDQELVQLWDFLGVNIEYRTIFIQKIGYFNESIQTQIISFEKDSLVKDIIVDLFSRDTSLKILRDAHIRLLNEAINSNHSNMMLKIRKELSNLKNIMIKIIGNLNKLKRMMVYGITKDKFNISKMDNSYILDPTFILKLNQSLQFLREGTIGKRFNLKSKFDPLLLDFEDKIDNSYSHNNEKLLIKLSNALLNEMVTNNLCLRKNQPSASSILSKKIQKPPSKTIIKIGQLHQKKEEKNKLDFDNNNDNNDDKQGRRNKKEMIECKVKEKDIKNNCDVDININHNSTEQFKDLNVIEAGNDYIKGLEAKEEKNNNDKYNTNDDTSFIDFYTKPFNTFKQLYKEYYNKIPSNQRSVFNLHEDIDQFTEGVNPLIIVQYNRTTISSLCLIVTDYENYNSLCLKHFSTINNDLKETIEQFITFVQSNIPFKEITINLYHEKHDGKLQLKKDINDLFKCLNFRWSKLENLEEGTRFQAMKYINSNYQNPLATRTNKEILFKISSVMIGYTSSITDTCNTNGNYINNMNKQIINSLINKSEGINEIKEAFNYINEFEGNKEETNKFISKKGYSLSQFNTELNDNDNQSSPLYTSCFELIPFFNSFISKTINRYNYNRVQVNKEVFHEKETNQSFYIIQQDNYLILIGEITSQFAQYINSANNIYEAFNCIYSNFEECQKDTTALWIPSFTINNDQAEALYDENSKIELSSLSNVIFNSCHYKDKTINITYDENEPIISNEFFLSIININQSTELNNPIVFCSIVNQSKWEVSES